MIRGLPMVKTAFRSLWARIYLPMLLSVDINGMVGLDSHGNAGLRDKVDRHYKRLFGFAALSEMFRRFQLDQPGLMEVAG